MSRSSAIAVLCALLGAGLSAQSSAPPQTPTFRTASTVIAVEAAVVDKSGNPITDLTAADFQTLKTASPIPQTIYLVSPDPNFTGQRPAPVARQRQRQGAACGSSNCVRAS
jgi:hypothetical protein